METKTLTSSGLSVINNYLNFTIGQASCSVPYFNNKTVLSRASLRVYIGKGTAQDISEEINSILIKSHISANTLSSESLKKLLTDRNLGIDCSGFAYHVLDAHSRSQNQKSLSSLISFTNCHGLIGKIRCSLRPIENCDVATMADDKNSSIVSIDKVLPGDIITIQGGTGVTDIDRDHVLVIHRVDYRDFIPTQIHYSHIIAYPNDGLYGTGVKQSIINITDTSKPLIEASWIEDGKSEDKNIIFKRAKNSTTEIRRIGLK